MKHSGFTIPAVGAQDPAFATDSVTGKVTEIFREVQPDGDVLIFLASDNTEYTPSATETVASAPIRYSLGSEVLTVENADIAKLANIPPNAVHAEVQVHLQDAIIFTCEGTDPSIGNHVGRLAMAGASIDIQGNDEISDFKVGTLNNTGDDIGVQSNLYIEYFNVTEDGKFIK